MYGITSSSSLFHSIADILNTSWGRMASRLTQCSNICHSLYWVNLQIKVMIMIHWKWLCNKRHSHSLIEPFLSHHCASYIEAGAGRKREGGGGIGAGKSKWKAVSNPKIVLHRVVIRSSRLHGLLFCARKLVYSVRSWTHFHLVTLNPNVTVQLEKLQTEAELLISSSMAFDFEANAFTTI